MTRSRTSAGNGRGRRGPRRGLFLAALIARRRSVPVFVAGVIACCPALDLWVEATQYVERNAYADYRIVELEDGARMLDVSGQAASRRDVEGRGWDYTERIERTLSEACEENLRTREWADETLRA